MLRKTFKKLPLAKPYLVVTTIAVLVFLPTWLRLMALWFEFEQVLAHGLATAFIFLWLVVTHTPKPMSQTTHPKSPLFKLGALILIGVTLSWTLLELARIDTLAYLALPVGLAATTWTLLGWQSLRTFLPYILLLSLSLPIWADLMPALVRLASTVVGTWVGWLNMPALIEGNSITLPYGRLVIADGCSGIRYFAISILLAMMTSILNDYRWRGWLVSLAAAASIALLVNWARITILVVVGYQSNMQSGLLADHEMMGWLVYAAFVLPALFFSPVLKRQDTHTGIAPKFHKSGFIAIAVAMLVGPAALLFFSVASTANSSWSVQINGSQKVEPQEIPIPLILPGSLQQQAWRSGNTWISLAQTQRRATTDKLVPYLPTLFDHSEWQLQSVKAGASMYRNIFSRKQVTTAQWYQVGSYRTESYSKAKLLQIPAMVKGDNQFALFTLQTPCAQRDCELAFRELQALKYTLYAQPLLQIEGAPQ